VGVEWKSRDAVIEEPGRRIVQEQTRTGGQALPWLDMTAFLRGAIDLALDTTTKSVHWFPLMSIEDL